MELQVSKFVVIKMKTNVIQLILRLLSVEIRLPDELWRKHVLKNKKWPKKNSLF